MFKFMYLKYIQKSNCTYGFIYFIRYYLFLKSCIFFTHIFLYFSYTVFFLRNKAKINMWVLRIKKKKIMIQKFKISRSFNLSLIIFFQAKV